MIVNLNLASQPFRNRALPWVLTAVIVSVSLVALALIILETGRTKEGIRIVERDLRELNQQTETLREQVSRMKQELSPDQAETLEATHLLVDRKRFSWSRLLADLEATVPPNVRVTRIRVREAQQRGGQMRAGLELTVVGRTPNDVIGMMTEMNRTGIFVADPVAEQTKVEKGESSTELTLRVSYMPRAISLQVATNTANVASSAQALTSSNRTQ